MPGRDRSSAAARSARERAQRARLSRRCRSARPGAVEVADERDRRPLCAARSFEAYDTHSASPQPAPLQVGRLRLRYLLETEERAGYLCIGLARVTEVTADRRVVLDDRWIPPALVCSAAPPLSGLITELVRHAEPARRGAGRAHDRAGPGAASPQVADFLLLQSINRWQKLLAHWADAGNIHPEVAVRGARPDGRRVRHLHRGDAPAEHLSGLSPRRSAAQLRAGGRRSAALAVGGARSRPRSRSRCRSAAMACASARSPTARSCARRISC